jgi:tetratricopeptide (TPR) repeat protein
MFRSYAKARCSPVNRRATNFWPFLLLLVFLGGRVFPGYGQESPSQKGHTAIPSGELVPLVVRDFIPWEHAEQSLSTDLLRAIPDDLYLSFLGYPRLAVSRGPAVNQNTSSVPQTDQRTGQIPRTRGQAFYSLAGQVGLVSPGATGADSTGGRGVQLFLVRYQVWLNAADSKSQPITDGSFVAAGGEVQDHLSEVARVVANKISPPDAAVNVFLPAVVTSCFSDKAKGFYEETLSGLLRTTLAENDFVKLTKDRAGAFVVTQSVEAAPGGCVVRGTLQSPSGDTLVADTEKGPQSEILVTQSQVNQKIVDALHIQSVSGGQKTGVSGSLSADQYLQTAAKYEQVDPDLAAALYRKALSVDATNKEAMNKLAQTMLDSGRPDDVIDLIRKPTDASQFVLLATAYLKLRNTAKALGELDEGMQLHPTDPKFYEQAASIIEQTGDYEAAANALEAGQKYAQPNDRLAGMANQTRRRGAAAFITAGKTDKALPLILASLEREPDSEWGERLAGIAYIRSGDTPRGEEYLNKAMHIMPTVYSEVELGSLRVMQKRYPEARAFARRAIEIDPKYGDGYDVLEDSVQNPQEASETVAWLEKYAKMDPPIRSAIMVRSYLQLKFLPSDSKAVHEQYEAYKAATKDVSYTDWPEAWANLIELSLVDHHVEEAAGLADAMLTINLSQSHRLVVGFYASLAPLVLGDCKSFETNFNGALHYLQSTDIPALAAWDFSATHKFIEDARARKILSQSGFSLAEAGLTLLEHSITTNTVQQFSETALPLEKQACIANPAKPSSGSPPGIDR